MYYFIWSKNKCLIIIGSFVLALTILFAVYFIFFYTPPAPPEVIPDTHTSIEIKIDDTLSDVTENASIPDSDDTSSPDSESVSSKETHSEDFEGISEDIHNN